VDADEDGAGEDGGAEDEAGEDGGDVGIGEAGVEFPIAVGAVDMGVIGVVLAVAGDDALAEADTRWLAGGDAGPPVAECAGDATAETWAAGLDRTGADVCPVAAVKANVAAETATRAPMPNISSSGHHRRRGGRLPSPGGPPEPGAG
jgi:hypothetical protein